MSETVSQAPAQATTQAEGTATQATEATAQGTTSQTQQAQPEASKSDAPAAEQAAQSSEKKEGSEAKAPEAQKSVVPEKYDLKLPEGSHLDAKAIESISLFAKEKGLSNEQAQGILEHENQAIASFVEGQKTELNSKIETWATQAQEDKEIGGEAFKQNVELAHRVLKRFASEEFNKTLNETGLGNHPELVRTFVRIGKQMADDAFVVPGAQAGPTEVRHADILFPSIKGD